MKEKGRANAINYFKKLMTQKIEDSQTEYYAQYYFYDLAIEALEGAGKADAKEVKFHPAGSMYGVYCCESCGTIVSYKSSYCPNCGQYLDWDFCLD